MTRDKCKLDLFITFLGPTLLIYGVFVVFPMFSTLYYSFFDWTGLNNIKHFIGMKNYLLLFSDKDFLAAMINNVLVILASVFMQIPLGLVMALIISRPKKRSNFLSATYFTPYLISTVAIGLIWSFLYDPMLGPINMALKAIGLKSYQILWLADKNLALLSLLIVVIWNHAPFYMLVFKASISCISEDYYEAAAIDGATTFQKFKNITFPLLFPAISNSVVLSIVGSLKAFDLFYIMTKGGPGSSTELMGTYMYKQSFMFFKMGYGSAAAFSMFFIAVLAIIFIKYTQNKIRQAASYE